MRNPGDPDQMQASVRAPLDPDACQQVAQVAQLAAQKAMNGSRNESQESKTASGGYGDNAEVTRGVLFALSTP